LIKKNRSGGERGVVTHGYCNVIHIHGILALASHSQLCIVDYKYRYGKSDFLNLIGYQACEQIFISKRHLPKGASDRISALARLENILALGIRATNFSGPT